MAAHPVGSTFEHDGVTWTIVGYEPLTVTERAPGESERTHEGPWYLKATCSRGAWLFRVTGPKEVEKRRKLSDQWPSDEAPRPWVGGIDQPSPVVPGARADALDPARVRVTPHRARDPR